MQEQCQAWPFVTGRQMALTSSTAPALAVEDNNGG
jgi:hypothetical protein